MYLVQESQGTVTFCQVANLLDRSNAAAHGIDRLESDNLGGFLGVLLELGFEVLEVVVLEDDLLGTRVTDTLDHRRVVHRVGEVDAAGEFRTECGQSSIVCDVAGRKDQSSLLAVEISELLLESQMHSTIAGNIASTASTVSVLVESPTEMRKSRKSAPMTKI